jgi:signal transduction histidine kinase
MLRKEKGMRGIRARLVLQFSIILLVIVLLLEVLFLLAVRSYYFGTAMETLTTRAATSATFFNKYLENYPLKDRARYILENLSLEEYAKIEILDQNGRVVVNSYGFSPSETVMTPDVAAAVKGSTGTYIGRATQSQERILAVSNPLKNLGTTIGVLRFSVSAEPLYTAVTTIVLYAAGVGLLAILIGFALSLLMAKRIVEPIKELTNVAGQMATGNFTVRAAKRHEDEVGTLAESFNYMAEELGKHEKLKNDFISSVSHELRTPLTSIKGWGETLISGGVEDAGETLQGVKVISKETDRLIGLVEELLDFSKFQSGEMKLVQQQFDLRVLLEEIKVQYGFRFNEKKIDLQVDIPEHPLPLAGDPNRLKQVFVNLLDNAFKFTPPHGDIRVRASRTNSTVIAEVTDTGEGIAPEDLPKVMEKFYKGSSKKSGSGLGLAICKGIVELHGGSFRVESELGKGTTVTVELPICQEAE